MSYNQTDDHVRPEDYQTDREDEKVLARTIIVMSLIVVAALLVAAPSVLDTILAALRGEPGPLLMPEPDYNG